MNASRMMTDILKGVMTNGTGTSYILQNAISAGKTGTTNNNYDVWMTGFTSYYTTAVWCGFDMPQNLSEYGYTKFAGNIWHDFMEKIHEGKEEMDFVPYMEVESTKDEVETSSDVTVEDETLEDETLETEIIETETLEDETVDEETSLIIIPGTYEEETTTYNNWEDEAESMGSYEGELEMESEQEKSTIENYTLDEVKGELDALTEELVKSNNYKTGNARFVGN